MTGPRALLDANVLYPAPMRDLFLQLAVLGVYQAKWSAAIHDGWMSALLRNEPWRDPRALQRTRSLMDNAVRDGLVTGFEALITRFGLPDPNDRHVMAAAIVGGCDVIVTRNVQDFPPHVLREHDLAAQEPDGFLGDLLTRNERAFAKAIRMIRSRLGNPPYSIEDYLDTLDQQGLSNTVSALRRRTRSLELSDASGP